MSPVPFLSRSTSPGACFASFQGSCFGASPLKPWMSTTTRRRHMSRHQLVHLMGVDALGCCRIILIISSVLSPGSRHHAFLTRTFKRHLTIIVGRFETAAGLTWCTMIEICAQKHALVMQCYPFASSCSSSRALTCGPCVLIMEQCGPPSRWPLHGNFQSQHVF